MQYRWAPDNTLDLVFVPGTHGNPFPFGEGTNGRPVEVRDFFIGDGAIGFRLVVSAESDHKP
jgi:hypothetical protein